MIIAAVIYTVPEKNFQNTPNPNIMILVAPKIVGVCQKGMGVREAYEKTGQKFISSFTISTLHLLILV